MCSHNVHKKFLVLDQTLVVFDIEQPRNAKQKIRVNRLSGVGPIYWRFQTNAPTHYVVSPNSGLLNHDEPVEVTITLYKNRFRPKHELFLQAVQALTDESSEKIWINNENVQIIPLDLGTTVMNIEKAIGSNKKSIKSVDLKQLLDGSATKGQERVEELQAILKMTKVDVDILENNIVQTKQLKTVLESQLTEKSKLVLEFKSKLAMIEGSYMRKSVEVERLRNEIVEFGRNTEKPKCAKETNVNCIIA